MEVDRVRRCIKDYSSIREEAPVLDVYVGLFLPDEYLVYIGDRDRAVEVLDEYDPYLIIPMRQFERERLNKVYHKRRGEIGA